eukprot:1385540-Amphidinium_carterae.1
MEDMDELMFVEATTPGTTSVATTPATTPRQKRKAQVLLRSDIDDLASKLEAGLSRLTDTVAALQVTASAASASATEAAATAARVGQRVDQVERDFSSRIANLETQMLTEERVVDLIKRNALTTLPAASSRSSAPTAATSSNSHTTDEEWEACRKRVVLGGFPDKTDRDIILDRLQFLRSLLDEATRGMVQDMSTVYIKGRVGFLHCRSAHDAEAVRAGLAAHKEQLKDVRGNQLWVGIDKTRAQKRRNAILLRAQAFANEKSDGGSRICWASGQLWLQEERVGKTGCAHPTQTREMQTDTWLHRMGNNHLSEAHFYTYNACGLARSVDPADLSMLAPSWRICALQELYCNADLKEDSDFVLETPSHHMLYLGGRSCHRACGVMLHVNWQKHFVRHCIGECYSAVLLCIDSRPLWAVSVHLPPKPQEERWAEAIQELRYDFAPAVRGGGHLLMGIDANTELHSRANDRVGPAVLPLQDEDDTERAD